MLWSRHAPYAGLAALKVSYERVLSLGELWRQGKGLHLLSAWSHGAARPCPLPPLQGSVMPFISALAP